MKKLIIAAAMAAACSAVASTAVAESYGSLGVGVTRMDFAAVGGSEASVTTVTGRLGWKSDSWYGVEGELYAGLGKDEVSTAPPVEVGISTSVALYGVAFLPVSEKASLHGRVGFNRLLGKVYAGGGSTETNDGALSYGVGGSYRFSDTKSVRADYTITDIDGVDTDAFAISFVHSF